MMGTTRKQLRESTSGHTFYLDGSVTLVSEPVMCLKAFGDVYLCPHALPLKRDILFASVKCFEIFWAVKLWLMIPASFSVGCERVLFETVTTLLKPSLALGECEHLSLPNQAPGTGVKITESSALWTNE